MPSDTTESDLLKQVLRRYPAERFRRYPRWRPGWKDPSPRQLRFLYVEMLADFLRANCAEGHFHQTWKRDGVQISCDSGRGVLLLIPRSRMATYRPHTHSACEASQWPVWRASR
jgi:hypothetical protein